MLASIGRRPLYNWSSVHSAIALGPSLKRTASAIGWGVAIGVGTMLFELAAVIGGLYASGIVAL